MNNITYDDVRLLEVPILLPSVYNATPPNEAEMQNLARYLMAGGFVFGGLWTEALEKYGGLVNGKDFWSERLPDDHPIFSVFFEIGGGPALGRRGDASYVSANYLQGHFIQGRLAGVTPGDGRWGWVNDFGGQTSTRQLQLAVNIIIYALTQEGSIAQRLMQMVN